MYDCGVAVGTVVGCVVYLAPHLTESQTPIWTAIGVGVALTNTRFIVFHLWVFTAFERIISLDRDRAVVNAARRSRHVHRMAATSNWEFARRTFAVGLVHA